MTGKTIQRSNGPTVKRPNGETPSKVWRPGENALQGLEVFPETASKARKGAERHLQGLEDERLRRMKTRRAQSAKTFREKTGMESAEACFFTKKPCPAARNCAFSVAESSRKDARNESGRPAVSRWSMCLTAIESNLETEKCKLCDKRAKCNAGNGFRLFRCFRLARKRCGETRTTG